MQKIQDAVNDTCFFEKGLPGHGAQQEIHPHGKNENQYDKAVLVYAHITKNHGKRIGKQEAQSGCNQGKQESKPQGLCVFRSSNRNNII